jgi:hypothetical protein
LYNHVYITYYATVIIHEHFALYTYLYTLPVPSSIRMDTCSSPGGQCTSTSSSADVGSAAPSGGGPSINATRPEANAGMPYHQATVTVTTTLMSRFKQEIMQWRDAFINDNRRNPTKDDIQRNERVDAMLTMLAMHQRFTSCARANVVDASRAGE